MGARVDAITAGPGHASQLPHRRPSGIATPVPPAAQSKHGLRKRSRHGISCLTAASVGARRT